MERARIEALMMEELEADAWDTFDADGECLRLAWWHEGAPDWYENDPGAEYRTAVVFGFGPHPQLAGWTFMGAFGLGERECPACATDVPDRPAVGSECPLCECPVERDRGGFLYLGEDCAEAVYRRRRVAPHAWAHLTEDGFHVEAYAGGFLDYGMRVTAPDGSILFDCPHYLGAEDFGADDETGEPWEAERWQEALEVEAAIWLDGRADDGCADDGRADDDCADAACEASAAGAGR